MNHRRTTALCLAGLLLTGGQLFAAKITRAKKAPESDKERGGVPRDSAAARAFVLLAGPRGK